MILKSLTILLILKTAFGNDEEAYVEISDERDYSQDRSGRLLHSIPQHPLMDIMLQTANNKYVPKVPGDFFDFLRDSYPLPGGLKAPYQEYDYVIVGAGSAGCVLASRLSENRNVTVLLLEVGKPEMIFTDMPALSAYFQSTEYSWPYYMEHQPGVCNGMLNKRCYWPRGRAVGGTSVINYMIYTRGRPEDWDRIAAAGNYGWSYNEVLEYYKKSEKAAGLGGYEKLPYRNRDGELPVEFVPYRTKLIKAFLEAGKLLGHPIVDYNAPDKLGFGYVQVTSSRGRRYSAAKSFLHDHKRRRNLHILPESTATKILIDETKTAYGIAYVRNKIKYTVKARREVILSAGPIASPQLLMLSGIGPKERLQSLGIPVIKDLPVGQTLYDHICFPGAIFELNTTGVSFNESKVLNLPSIITWIQNGDNPISSPGGVEGIGYIKTPVSDDPAPVPDVELISIGGSILSDGGVGGSKAARKGMRISNTIFEEAFGELDRSDKDTWSAFPMLLHPKSVGRLELKDSNPFSHPLMYGNYLSDPRDVAAFIASIRYVQALAATEPFQKYGAKIYRAQYPDCKAFFFDSDEYWECALRTFTATLHHQTATCRMGPKGDPLAIVDPELRVYGINRLRVGDSSVFPRTISAHTNAPAIMVGEKLSDLLKLTWNSVPYQHG